MRARVMTLLLIAAIAAAVSAQGRAPAQAPQGSAPPGRAPAALSTDARDPIYLEGPKAEAVGDKVMVSTQLAVVTEAALAVLRSGGNAVDAAVTAVFMQHVNEYHQVSVFGAMSGLYYEASSGKTYAFNGFSERPRADRGDRGDPMKVAIGGTVRTLESLQKRFGTRTWAADMQPAIKSAEEGPLVTSFMYGNNYSLLEDGDTAQNREARAFYMPDGHLVPVGHHWKMPALAATLRRIASEGADYLYKGEWAQKFVKEATRRGGRVTLDDLAEYETLWLEPVRFTYRGHEMFTEPAPNKGGLLVAHNLNILENFDLKRLGRYSESPEALEVMARAFGRVEDEMRFAFEDPRSFRNPIAFWLSKEYGKTEAEFVRQTMPLPNVSLAPVQTTIAEAAPDLAAPSTSPDIGSNHDVIVDAQGNWISFLHTGHGGAPGVFIDGIRATGSNVRSRTSGPGRRILAEVTATFVAKDGKPWMSLGTPGFPPQPVTEVLVNILDHGMHPRDAADAPRFWAFLNNDREVRIESRISKKVRDGMAASGIKMKELGDYTWHTGSMQIIWRDAATGKLHGVTDPRRLGFAAGF
jgi:gamma-glutamyltranspeptidase/glutathione hydrolase